MTEFSGRSNAGEFQWRLRGPEIKARYTVKSAIDYTNLQYLFNMLYNFHIGNSLMSFHSDGEPA